MNIESNLKKIMKIHENGIWLSVLLRIIIIEI